jgi:hypothetical protein
MRRRHVAPNRMGLFRRETTAGPVHHEREVRVHASRRAGRLVLATLRAGRRAAPMHGLLNLDVT